MNRWVFAQGVFFVKVHFNVFKGDTQTKTFCGSYSVGVFQISPSYKTFWIDVLKGNTHLREWTLENFQKRQLRSFSRYVQWIPIARSVTSFRRRKKQSIYSETSANRPDVKTDRFKNVFVNRIIVTSILGRTYFVERSIHLIEEH